MAKSGINLPASGGGLIRYNEEYKSKLTLKPVHVILLVVLIIAFTLILKIVYPIK